ncbi:hypothetical protein [Pseudomonas veronii]
MKQVSTHDRYIKQIVGKIGMFEAFTDPKLVRFFQVIRKAGNTLPQETLIGLEVDSEMEKEF